MRTSIFVLSLLMVSLIVSCSSQKDSSVRVMTYNIRYANENLGEEWSLRKKNVAEMIRFHNPDIFGLQEALKKQVDFISSEFPDYKWIGIGRDDGAEQGEYSPIFYSSNYTLLESETIWLSPTPDTPSVGWDAALNRIATHVKLLKVSTDETIHVINTHFDHQGVEARKQSAKLLINTIENLNDNNPVILMGDFNITDTTKAYQILTSNLLNDAYSIAKYPVYGTYITFNGFKDVITEGSKIDFIFVNDKIEVLHHAIIGDKFDGRYPSDHMPVVIDCILK